MSTLYIEEFSHLAQDGNGMPIAAGRQPSITYQQVSFTGTAGQSAAFNASTRFVRLIADADFSYLFGTNPTAVAATHPRAKANVVEFHAIDPALVGGALKVSAIT